MRTEEISGQTDALLASAPKLRSAPMVDDSKNGLRFDDRVVIVTGGGRGLGRSHAMLLASRGALVVVNDPGNGLDGRPEPDDPAGELVNEIVSFGGTAIADRNTVANPQGAKSLVEETIQQFGRVDVVINNAGILRDQAFHNLSEENIRSVLDVHLLGAFWVTQAAWRGMRERRYGRIIMTTSVGGLIGNFGQSNYCAAKMGLVGLTRALSVEGDRYGIRVNAIAPGAATRMTSNLSNQAASQLSPDLVSPAVVWLAHEDCELNGEILCAGGGHLGRFLVIETQGISVSQPTAEIVRDRWNEISDTSDFVTAHSIEKSMALLFNDSDVQVNEKRDGKGE